MTLDEANELWYELAPIDGIIYRYNDCVRIKSGNHHGENATVISLTSVDPITYLVELGSGDGDIVVAESEIEIFL
jgi:hypothetical protein